MRIVALVVTIIVVLSSSGRADALNHITPKGTWFQYDNGNWHVADSSGAAGGTVDTTSEGVRFFV